MTRTTHAYPLQVIKPSGHPREAEVLGDDARLLVSQLAEAFTPRVTELLAKRRERQREFDRRAPGFSESTREIRERDWTVAPVPEEIADRRAEIVGPADRKTMIEALNSGANAFMADLEDATSPTWFNIIDAHANLIDAARGTIELTPDDPRSGGTHRRLNEQHAVLFMRPRGWHLPEKHARHEGNPVPAALFDFALFMAHNARERLAQASRPYLYLPKLESHTEARLWNDVIEFCQDTLGLPRGTVRATVLIETLPAAFEMDEILYELRDHAAGLSCGRWDYTFSVIKTFNAWRDRLLPDRNQLSMTQPFMQACARRLIDTAHRRGCHAIGGMAAHIPAAHQPDDHTDDQAATDRLKQDKHREAALGYDGTSVAHPALVPVARAVFDEHMKGPNQINRPPETQHQSSADDLLAHPTGEITEEGVRQNIRVGVRYLAAWLEGHARVQLGNAQEHTATAEISRAQLWQWVRHGATLADSRTLDRPLLLNFFAEEIARMERDLGDETTSSETFRMAEELLLCQTLRRQMPAFITTEAYDRLE